MQTRNKHLRSLKIIAIFSKYIAFIALVLNLSMYVYAQDKTTEVELRAVTLEWEAIEDAFGYQVEVQMINEDGSRGKKFNKKTKLSQWEAKLPVGKYEMKIRSYDPRRVPGEWSEAIEFVIKPKAVSLFKPIDNDVIIVKDREEEEVEVEFQWSKSTGGKGYKLEVKSTDGDFNQTEEFTTTRAKVKLPIEKSFQWNVTPFINKEIIGDPVAKPYQLNTQYAPESLVSEQKAKSDGEKLIDEGEVKDKSKPEYKSNYFYLMSYLITQIDYTGVDKARGNSNQVKAVGGTGRLGVGYLKPESRWGMLGILDLSGFNIGSDVANSDNFTFASAEVHGLYSKKLINSEFQVSFGLYMKELVALQGDSSGNFSGVGKVKNFGPHVGFKYWMPWGEKLGIQFNGRFYSAVSGDGPNGESISPEVSYEFGVLGTYKLTKTFTGFAGIKHRTDRSSYTAITANEDPNSLANPGDVSFVEITGSYLNFILEYRY
ncbi:MAG: hypothetical protein KDD58_14530 [Bdellovibrionales bacterium]|nr:hypothetical protein [Bdellovibrionales bacterium]